MTQPESPSLAFAERVSYCCKQVGSAAELARRIGISPAAVTKYQTKGAEPGVFTVVKMAEASGVSLVWLATGKGAPGGGEEPKIVGPRKDNPPWHEFTERLRESYALMRRNFGIYSVETPINQDRLDQLLNGARPELEDIASLARMPLMPLVYVLCGNEDQDRKRNMMVTEYTYTALVYKFRAIDEKRRIAAHHRPSADITKKTRAWQEPLFELFATIYEKLEPKHLLVHTVIGDSLSSALPQGTLVLAAKETIPTRPGLYLFSYQQNTKDPKESAFVARVSLGETGFFASFSTGNNPQPSLDVAKLNTLGRVILTVTLTGT